MADPEFEVRLPPGPYRAHQAEAVDAVARALAGGQATVSDEDSWLLVLHLAHQIPGTRYVVALPTGGEVTLRYDSARRERDRS